MSHNLYMDESGEAAIAYAGETPWHRFGQKIDEADVYNVDAALEAAHATFTVETVPMWMELVKGEIYKKINNRVVIRRTDTLAPLGVATNRYKVCLLYTSPSPRD